ncbi:TatD family hydrolase [uncultured Thomasclavelia sp.]|uniref:TatD family hydrolase n=1 Tax=uncultured Thomasclavelia sp. TaxID=3025759 RepID=UPI0025D4DA4B|nr:TatD family hydrolase [uncultured Thomasclavelia sp.]
MYFDTHCHLNSEELYENHDFFVSRALDNQVNHMVVVGYTLESSKKAIELANQYDFIYAAVGIGPNDCLETTKEDMAILEEYLKAPKVVALGEIGLDYYWDTVGKEKQMEVFQWQMDLAKKYQKPVVIHCRDAYEDTYQVLKRNGHPGIMHCYSGSVEMAKRFIDIGFYISLAGPVTFKNARVPKDVAANIDLDNLLIETDCPYLTPHPYRGKLNEPANVVYIAQEIAKLKNMEIENVARATTFNAKKVFGIK